MAKFFLGKLCIFGERKLCKSEVSQEKNYAFDLHHTENCLDEKNDIISCYYKKCNENVIVTLI